MDASEIRHLAHRLHTLVPENIDGADRLSIAITPSEHELLKEDIRKHHAMFTHGEIPSVETVTQLSGVRVVVALDDVEVTIGEPAPSA